MDYKQALLTGATGHIGRHLAVQLARSGWRVLCPVRPRKGRSAAERLARALALTLPPGESRELIGTLVPIAADLEAESPESAGRLEAELRRWGRLDAVWHCAATTDLNPRRVFTRDHENLNMTRRALELFERTGAARFFYVGTAFSCGRVPRGYETEPGALRPRFRNAYERSKWESERRLWASVREALTVFRPSIVLASEHAERVESWQGYYAYIRKLSRILQRLPQREHYHGRSIGFYGSAETRLDLVFVDWVVEAMLRIAGRADSRSGIFNLTSPKPLRLGDLIEDFAAVTGKRLEPTGCPLESVPRLGPILAAVTPYLIEGPAFDRRRTRAALGEGALGPRATDLAIRRRHLALAAAQPACLVS